MPSRTATKRLRIARGLRFNLNLALGVIALASTFFTVRLLSIHASDGSNIVSIAKSQIGYHETGGTPSGTGNCTKYAHRCEAWCADFLSWVYANSGNRIIKGTGRSYSPADGDWDIPSTGDMKDWFAAHGQWYGGYQLSHIQPGDMVYTNGDGSGHVGIVVSANQGGIDTIAGNWGQAVQEYQTPAGDVIGTGHFDNWYAVGGTGKDIGAGRAGVWIAGTNGDLYQRVNNNTAWADKGGGGLVNRVDVDSSSAWIISGSSHTLVRYISGTYRGMNAVAADVGTAWNGAVWLDGTNGKTYRWTGKTDCPGHTLSYCWPTFSNPNPYIVRIEGTAGGNTWALSNESDTTGNVYDNSGSPWHKNSGGLADVGIGPNNEVWGVNHNHAIFYRNESNNWANISGGAQDITVDSNGIPWMIGTTGTIYRYMR